MPLRPDDIAKVREILREQAPDLLPAFERAISERMTTAEMLEKVVK